MRRRPSKGGRSARILLVAGLRVVMLRRAGNVRRLDEGRGITVRGRESECRARGQRAADDFGEAGAKKSARVSGPTIGYTLDAAGNREEVDNNGTPELYTLALSMNQYTQTPFDSDILHDDVGNLSSIDTRAKVFTYDVHNRLTRYLIAGTRSHETFNGSGNRNYYS